MSKGYIKISRELIQNFNSYNLTEEEFCFLLRILSHKKGYVLTDEMLGINRIKAYRIRKSLKEKEFINFYSVKNVGTKYYINVKKIIELTNDTVETEPLAVVEIEEEVKSDFDMLKEEEKEYLIGVVSGMSNVSLDTLYRYKKGTLDMFLTEFRSRNG